MATAKAQDAALGKPLETAKPEVKQKRKGPDSLLYRALVWLLLNGQIFSPNRDLITEGAYMRMRGGKKWPWVANTSFAFMHDHTEEDIRGLYNEPLGKIGVRVAHTHELFHTPSCKLLLYFSRAYLHLVSREFLASHEGCFECTSLLYSSMLVDFLCSIDTHLQGLHM